MTNGYPFAQSVRVATARPTLVMLDDIVCEPPRATYPVLTPWYLDAAATPFSPYQPVPLLRYATLAKAMASAQRVRRMFRYYAVRVRAV